MEPINRRRWEQRCPEPQPQTVDSLSRSLDVRPLTAQVLARRGIVEVDAGRSFLSGRLAELPDPHLLSGMEAASRRIADAVERREKIAIHGDYDVDGISGTALLVEFLRLFGGVVDFYIPLRLQEGYGLSGAALERAAANGARVAISVDCGITAREEAQQAKALGLDLIITDHHQAPEDLPQALALINPHLPGQPACFRDLCGAGVAFFLLMGVRRELRSRGHFNQRCEPDLRLGLDLVALGTIADLVPLRGVNRLLTRFGLTLLDNARRPGIRALKDVSGVREISCGSVAFQLAPRLNAAGRLEDAAQGVAMLLTDSLSSAQGLAQRLDACNRQRQSIEEQTLAQALERIAGGGVREATHTIVLADERWHPGVIGIVASRLVERYHRPTVLIALDGDTGKGSARSIKGFHLYQAMAACADSLQAFGGHEMAAGIGLKAEQVKDFAAAFELFARQRLEQELLTPRIGHDGEVFLEELDFEGVRELAGLAPFGMGNPEPVFMGGEARAQQVREVGRGHLQFVLRQGGCSFPAIAFGMAERRRELQGPLEVLFSPQLNQWKGRLSIQLRIRDFRVANN